MIAKVSTGRSFGGTIRYLHEGHRGDDPKKGQVDKRAQLLDYNGIRPGMAEMIKDFDRHRWLNPDLGNAVGHISLSYHQQDSAKLSDAKMVQHARQLMTRLGMNPEETQFVLIRHHDCAHQHCHLVYNRVDYQGKTISDQFSKSRAKEAATMIARQEGLTIASEQKKEVKQTQIARLSGYDQARYKIYMALGQVLPKATSLAELRQALKSHQIETIPQKGGLGMTFQLDGHPIKASLVDRSYSGYKIYKTLDRNRVLKESLAIPLNKPMALDRPVEKPAIIKGYTLTSQEKAQLIAGAMLRLQLIGDDAKPYTADVQREGDLIRIQRVLPPQPTPQSAPPAKEKPVTIKGYTLTNQEKIQLLAGATLRLQLVGDDTKPYSADVTREGDQIRVQRVLLSPLPPTPPVKEKPVTIKGYTLTSQEKTQLLAGDRLRLQLTGDDGKPFSADVNREGNQIRIQRVPSTPTPSPLSSLSVEEKPFVIKGYTLTSQEKNQLLDGASLRLQLTDEASNPFSAEVTIQSPQIRIEQKPAPVVDQVPPQPTLLPSSPGSPAEPVASAAEKQKAVELAAPPTWHAKALKEYTRLGGRISALQYNGFSVDPVRVRGEVIDYLLRPHGSPAKAAVKLSELLASQPIDQKLNVNKGRKLK